MLEAKDKIVERIEDSSFIKKMLNHLYAKSMVLIPANPLSEPRGGVLQPALTTFWYVCYALHPKTEVWQHAALTQ